MAKQTYEQKRLRATINFWNKVQIPADPNACWGWNGLLKDRGYGAIGWPEAKGYFSAHVVSYLIHTGLKRSDLPTDPTNPTKRMSVLHKCSNKSCSNPLHLKLGTNKENRQDAIREGAGKRGKAAPRLTDEQAAEFIHQYMNTNKTQQQLSREMGLAPSVAYYIVHGHEYRKVLPHIERPIKKVNRRAA